ncbi:MAG: ABC transporter substrate-binding protein [Lachnospiraceae bacterium]
MKKRFLSLLIVVALVTTSFLACSSKKEVSNTEIEGSTKEESITPTTVVLNEVAHSIFYAPMYVAIQENYFKDEGIQVTLVTGFGADKTMSAVLSGDADIGFMGPETTIYTYNEGSTDYIVNFAQLTQRAGNFLVAREENSNFKWSDLKEKTILGGRKGGMPEMVFEYILKQEGLDPATDVTINQGIDFGATAAAFSSGLGDYTIEFEPAATTLESGKKGSIVASLGTDSGYVPYTAFCAKSSYIEKNQKIIQGFTNALQKGMIYCKNHSSKEIAAIIAPQFKETDISTLTTIVERYHAQDTWKDNLVFEKESFELLQDILESANELKARADYEQLVTTEFAANAIK